MSVCAVMLVKDEADIIAAVVEHLLAEVDEILVADNLSADGTSELLAELAATSHGHLSVYTDAEVGYFQSRKTTELAQHARARLHAWVIPCDADEVWYSPHGRISDVLAALPRTALFAPALLYNHIGTDEDDPALPPLERLGWRIRPPGELPKIACRLSPDLRIGMGNHDATSFGKVRSDSPHSVEDVLVIRHFPWRSEQQFLRKITNGALAYAAAVDLDETFGQHWRQFGLPDDPGFAERVTGWYWQWGHAGDPRKRADLIHDPVADALAARASTITAQ